MVYADEYTVARFQMRADVPDATENDVIEAWYKSDKIWGNIRGIGEERYNEEYDVLLISTGDEIRTILRGDLISKGDRGDYCTYCGKDRNSEGECKKCNGYFLENRVEEK